MDTLDCTYCCNRTSPPVSQSNERKATPREVKKPLATVPPPTIYILSKNSPCSLNIQVELTSLTSLASISTSMLLDSGATGMFINWSFMQKHQLETTPLPQPVLVCNIDGSPNENSVDGVGRTMVRCISHLWRLVSVIGIHCYYFRMRIPS